MDWRKWDSAVGEPGLDVIHQAVHQKLMCFLHARRIAVPDDQSAAGEFPRRTAIAAEKGDRPCARFSGGRQLIRRAPRPVHPGA